MTDILLTAVGVVLFLVGFLAGFVVTIMVIDHYSSVPADAPEAAMWGIPASYIGTGIGLLFVWLTDCLIHGRRILS